MHEKFSPLFLLNVTKYSREMNWMIFIASKRGRLDIYKLHNFNDFIITTIETSIISYLLYNRLQTSLKLQGILIYSKALLTKKAEQSWVKLSQVLGQKGQKTIFPQNILERVLISCVCVCVCVYSVRAWFYGKDLDSSRRAQTKWDVSKVSTGLQAQSLFEEVVGL